MTGYDPRSAPIKPITVGSITVGSATRDSVARDSAWPLDAPSEPAAPVSAPVSAPEHLVAPYLLVVYWTDGRGHRLALQRSLVVAQCGAERLAEKVAAAVAALSKEAGRSYAFELLTVDDMARLRTPQPLPDSYITLLQSELVIVRRSPRTGDIFEDPVMRYCPKTRARLTLFITSEAHLRRP